MSQVEATIDHLFDEVLTLNGLTEEAFEEVGAPRFLGALPKLAGTAADSLLSAYPRWLSERRNSLKQDIGGVLRSWQEPLELLEVIIAISEAEGAKFNDEMRPKAFVEQDHKFEALTNLHCRGLLMAAEIECLLRSGFPDGAMTRWRSLHEVAVTAGVLFQGDVSLARDYRQNMKYREHCDRIAYQKFAETHGADGYTDDEIAQIRGVKDEIEKTPLGGKVRQQYGWACRITGKSRPRLEDLEQLTGDTHMAAYYVLASEHTHGHREATHLLPTRNADMDIFPIGPTNRGLEIPLQLVTRSFANLTEAVLLSQPTPRRVLVCELVWHLGDLLWESVGHLLDNPKTLQVIRLIRKSPT